MFVGGVIGKVKGWIKIVGSELIVKRYFWCG